MSKFEVRFLDKEKGKTGTIDVYGETIEEVLNLCDKEFITGLSILGGEPMHPLNIKGTRYFLVPLLGLY